MIIPRQVQGHYQLTVSYVLVLDGGKGISLCQHGLRQSKLGSSDRRFLHASKLSSFHLNHKGHQYFPTEFHLGDETLQNRIFFKP